MYQVYRIGRVSALHPLRGNIPVLVLKESLHILFASNLGIGWNTMYLVVFWANVFVYWCRIELAPDNDIQH